MKLNPLGLVVICFSVFLSFGNHLCRAQATRAATSKSEVDLKTRTVAEPALSEIDAKRATDPTLVTLELENATPLDAVRELAKQSGVPLEPWKPAEWPQGNIKLKFDRKPFWTALRELCAASELSPSVNYGNDRRILLAPTLKGRQNLSACPTIVDGAFMVIAIGILRNDVVNFGSDPKPLRNLSVQLLGFVEPKAKVIRVGYRASVDEALDEKGRSLVPEWRFDPSSSVQPIRGFSWQTEARLMPLPEPSQKLVKLRGTIRCLLETRADVYEIPNVTTAKPTAQTVGNRNIEFQGFEKMSDRQYEVHLTIYREKNEDLQQFNDVFNDPKTELLDTRNRPLAFQGSNGGRSGEDKGELRFRYRAITDDGAGGNTGEPAKFTWRMSTATQSVDIPFEFTDLPMP